MDKKLNKDGDKKTPNNKGSKSKNKLIAIGIIAAIAAGVAYYLHESDNTVDKAFAAIDGIPCETQEYTTYHVHAHLDVFVNGQHITVPQYVGIMAGGPNNQQFVCLYWLHTHDTTGIMHIESPQETNFTLNQFLDVWKKTSTGALPDGEPIIFVNGQEVSTNLESTELHAHDELAIVYGTAPPNIPSFYQFPEGL
ncbi:hypothetical protein DYY67_0859 [Candidatus Nitrosotalea sp. TS]|uniref:hypothetical protein n=1 Tax=Candidatus Nitrosotalea sp. TS TaxID=2341020 RepID=UPI0014099060|nr:hypothetical protein [Candidatus Nitrosotalea sp. TS]NHI03789.1 hypothetical protein [Candidatus Nitrosotalea sp. TS]